MERSEHKLLSEFDPALLAESEIMHYVYMLQSIKKSSCTYIGTTNDLGRRLAEHNGNKVDSTKSYAPFKLVYYESYLDQRDALNRERKLKHHGSVIGHLKKRLKYSLSK